MDLVNNSLEIINNRSRYRRVREVSKKIYDWQVLTSAHYDKYKEIYENYF